MELVKAQWVVFKNAYNQIRQAGALLRLKQKWQTKSSSTICGDTQNMKPISFNKIVSVIVLLLLGLFLAIILLSIEKSLPPKYKIPKDFAAEESESQNNSSTSKRCSVSSCFS